MDRVTVKTLSKLAASLSVLTGIEYLIRPGSKFYGNTWQLTTINQSHVFLYGITAAELDGKMRAYYSGFYDAKHGS